VLGAMLLSVPYFGYFEDFLKAMLHREKMKNSHKVDSGTSYNASVKHKVYIFNKLTISIRYKSG